MSHVHEPTPCTIESVLPDFDSSWMTQEQKSIAEEYFTQFAEPVLEPHEGSMDVVCFHCGDPLFGTRANVFGQGGYFQTRNVGHGKCKTCSWPGRSHHVVLGEDGLPLLSIGVRVLMFLENPEETEQDGN